MMIGTNYFQSGIIRFGPNVNKLLLSIIHTFGNYGVLFIDRCTVRVFFLIQDLTAVLVVGECY